MASSVKCNASSQTTSRSTKSDIKQLLANKQYQKLLPFVAVLLSATTMPLIIVPALGAEWFAHCPSISAATHESSNSCAFDYTRYNFYCSLFDSINGFVTFLFSGLSGFISDKYGRKPLLYCCIVLAIVNNAIMIFYINLYLYWSVQAINAMFAIPTIITAYISDIVPEQSLKTIGYSLLFAFGSVFFFIASILGAVIGAIGTHSEYLWMTTTALYIALLIYTIFFIEESHPISSSQQSELVQFSMDDINPIKPLLYVNHNPIILWVSITNLILAVPMSFFDVLIVFLNEQLQINNAKQSDLLNMTLFVSMAISSIVTAAVILPYFKRFAFATDVNIVIIGVIFVMFGQLIFSLVPYIQWIDTHVFALPLMQHHESASFASYFLTVVIASVCLSFFTFTGSALNSILTKYIHPSEHGLAFGIMQSCGAITSIFAPFLFGYGYNVSKSIGIPSLMLYIISFLLCACLLILLLPLRSSIAELEKSKTTFSLYGTSKMLHPATLAILTETRYSVNCNNYLTFDA